MLRAELEKREDEMLKPYAARSSESQGRKFPEAEGQFRTVYQKDRDRIIHSKAFRRLSGKTQVFLAHYGDHYRTRLSHSLEVAQISRGIARSLGLNEDLAEAISLAHDLGHTPFGHAGEKALNEIMKEFGLNFEHNEQSRRIVSELEQVYPNFRGLNLSQELLIGLMKHETPWDKPQNNALIKRAAIRPSLEAEIVNLADEIAYQNHDIDDGLRAGIINTDDLSGVTLWQKSENLVKKLYGKSELKMEIYAARTISAMIGLMINDVLEESQRRLKNNKIIDSTSVKNFPRRLIAFSSDGRRMNDELRRLLMEKVYFSTTVSAAMERGKALLDKLFWKYFEGWQDYWHLLSEQKDLSPSERVILIKDYIAGMTDSFANEEALRIGV